MFSVIPVNALFNGSAGLWSECLIPTSGGWTARVCTEFRKSSICNGWYQTARVASITGIALSILVCILAVCCAMQSVITTALPLLCLVIMASAGIVIALVPGAWIIFAGTHCNDSEASASASFILFVISAVLNLFGTCLATYLFKADILCPTEGPVFREEYKPYPSVYEIAPTYTAAPLAYPTPTYASAPIYASAPY
jgi:hypothetical protein